MVSTSKILTVSYGTFSCTLEGFDDSFDTMKAIAEYFRDLAADDRYFGAEPPTPDAEMLARIAEREIARRVEAEASDGRIHLRAAALDAPASQAPESDAHTPDAPAQQATQPDETAPALMAATSGGADAEGAAMSPARDMAEPPAAEIEPARPAAPDTDSVADKLRRIRAVASPAASAYDGFYNEDEHAQDFLSTTAADLDAALAEDDLAVDNAQSAGEAEAAPAMDEYEPSDAETADAGETAPETPSEPADDTAVEAADEEADMLARLTDTAEATSAEDGADDGTAIEVIADAPAEDAPIEDAPTDAEADSAPDTAEVISRDEDEDAAEDDLAALLDTVSHQDAAAPSEDLPETADDANLDGTAELDAAQASQDGMDNMDETDQDPSEDTLAQLLADALGDDTSAPRDDAAMAEPETETGTGIGTDHPLRARVIKMKRADLDAALAGGDLVEDGASASSLSPEAEADLQRELAEVEAELRQTRDAAPDDMPQAESIAQNAVVADPVEDAAPRDSDDEGATLASDEDAADDTAEAEDTADHGDAAERIPSAIAPKRAVRLGQIGTDTQAPRIFEEADSQLEEPVGNERRNAIQHLRAAVAATKAERSAGGAMSTDVDDQPYRLDLESAVRPRRPRPVAGNGTPRPERPSAERPAPLKLVAEQRVDAPAQPVRPRRISRADLTAAAPRPAPAEAESPAAPPQDSAAAKADTAPRPAPDARAIGSFTEFADQMGAKGLTDLLEAAAAYLSDVEGMPQFSRPMLMQKLNEVDDTDFSREEGLRSFGQLLRQGKLQKLKGGRFAVTDETEFRRSA